MKLLVGTGGTGGHIIPALAVAMKMKARGWEAVWIGNADSLEANLAARNCIPFLPIKVQKLYRSFTWQHLRFPFLLAKSMLRSLKYMRKEGPDAVLCTGGFVSGPVALAAIMAKRNLYFQDGNSYPGLTTRVLSGWARRVFIASDMAKKFLSRSHCLITGNPTLPFAKLEKDRIRWEDYNLSVPSKKLFIIGGSQGSYVINRVVSECVESLLSQGLELIWQTGKKQQQELERRFGSVRGIHIFGFTDRMSDYYQMSDLAVSRAGALSIAELNAHRVPAVFIPLPSAADNHQYKNALHQSQQSIGIILEQKDLTPWSLLEAISYVVNHLQDFKQRLAAMPVRDAVALIAGCIEQDARQLKEKIC